MVNINKYIARIVQENNTFFASSTLRSTIMYPTTGSSTADNFTVAAAASSEAPASSPSSSVYPLFAFFVFKNIFNQDLIRSIHVYQIRGQEKWIYREFLFSPGSCMEIHAPNLGILLPASMPLKARRQMFQNGQSIGLWLCILAFDPAIDPWASYSFPEILCPSRNPKLKFVPTLYDDLERVFEMIYQAEMCQADLTEKLYYSAIQGVPHLEDAHSRTFLNNNQEMYYEVESHKSFPAEMNQGDHFTNQQINHNEYSGSEENIENFPKSMRLRRAEKERVAKITLSNIAEHFNLPIAEAAKKLNLGLTLLKRKCRDFGIPKWPFRKIKSLQTLIHNLQEEAQLHERENKPLAARRAIEKRKRMLESEKDQLLKFPCLDLHKETKKFRQYVFKRRSRAKVSKNGAKRVNNKTNLPPSS